MMRDGVKLNISVNASMVPAILSSRTCNAAPSSAEKKELAFEPLHRNI
jgi:hypothetical protein